MNLRICRCDLVGNLICSVTKLSERRGRLVRLVDWCVLKHSGIADMAASHMTHMHTDKLPR